MCRANVCLTAGVEGSRSGLRYDYSSVERKCCAERVAASLPPVLLHREHSVSLHCFNIQ